MEPHNDVVSEMSATMASGCSSEETLSVLRTCDFATAISQGTVSEEMLEQCAQEGRIDVRNKEGQTPLMLACLTGLEDVVKFLLANGANPNSNSLMKGNTPLHFACMVEDTVEEKYLFERCYKPKKWTTTKVSIAKLLLNCGASVQKNLDGWTPACVAAFYMFKDIVDFFLLMGDGSPLEDKITASQILGVSQATLEYEPAPKDKDASFHSFRRALELQRDAGVITGQAETSELAFCFSKLSLTEFHTFEELWSVRSSESALKAHAFLVGERLFPPSLKQRYLYPSITHFASRLMFHEDMVEAGFQIFSCTLGFERHGELQLGTVLGHIANEYQFHCVYDGKKGPQPLVRQHARDLLCAYDSVVNNVHIDSLLEVCHSLMDSFGDILFAEVFSGFGFDDLKSTLEDVERLLRVIRGRVFRERQDEYPKMPSVAIKIMTLLLELLGSGRDMIENGHLLMVKFVLLRVLLSDNASYQTVSSGDDGDDASDEDESSGYTLLHMVACFTYSVEYFECIQDLAQDLALVLLRHGCPIDAVNGGGFTAIDILRVYEDQNIHLIQTLVSAPTTVLRLEEAAARVVLQHKINYQDVLPLRLRELVDGGIAELELELLKLLKTNEDSSEDSSEDNE